MVLVKFDTVYTGISVKSRSDLFLIIIFKIENKRERYREATLVIYSLKVWKSGCLLESERDLRKLTMGEQGDEQEVRHPQKKYYRQRAVSLVLGGGRDGSLVEDFKLLTVFS